MVKFYDFHEFLIHFAIYQIFIKLIISFWFENMNQYYITYDFAIVLFLIKFISCVSFLLQDHSL